MLQPTLPLPTATPPLTDIISHRALRCGVDALTDAEVLALHIGRDAPSAALASAARLIDQFGSLGRVLSGDYLALTHTLGDGDALALIAAAELCRRRAQAALPERIRLPGTVQVEAYLRAAMGGRARECVRVLYLDADNRLIADKLVSDGSPNVSPLTAACVIRPAIEFAASAFLMAHCHPSGRVEPSAADKEITRRIHEGAKALGISFHDHIIIGDSAYSFRANGLL